MAALALALWRNRKLRAETVQRQEAQCALRAERDLLETVFDATVDAILVLDANYRVITANRTAAARFGLNVAELRGRDLLTLTEPDAAALRRERYAQAMATGRPVRFRDVRAGRTYDNVLCPLPAASGGKARLAIYARDVTKEIEADARLRENRERLDKIFHLTPAVIVITSRADSCYRDVNKTFTDVTGYAREEVLGRCNDDLGIWLDPKDRERVIQCIERDGVVRNMEIQVLLKDGRVATGLLSCTPLDVYGEPCVLSVMMDISEQKTMERELRRAKEAAEAASQAKTRFLSVMSHEVRTPMNTILGMVDVLRDTGLTDRQTEFLAALEQAAESLLAQLEDMLTVSRIDCGTLELREAAYDPAALAREAVRACTLRAADKGLDLSLDLTPDVPAEAYGDTAKIRQVLDRLLDNAVKFTTQGSIRLELSRASGNTPGGELRYSVIDTGEGIPVAMRQAIFEPFTLLDASTTRAHGGAGLGLALCAQLARAIGGVIALQSEPGKGSTFSFSLPVDSRATHPEKAALPPNASQAWTTPPVAD